MIIAELKLLVLLEAKSASSGAPEPAKKDGPISSAVRCSRHL